MSQSSTAKAQAFSPSQTLAAAPIPANWVGVACEGTEACGAANTGPTRIPLAPSPVVAKRRDGTTYAGDLIPDVLAYRALRWRSLRGEVMTAEDMRRFVNLESKLRHEADGSDAAAALRLFYRFDCSFPARVVYTDSHGNPQGTDVTVQDMSAGGVKVAWVHDGESGERVELVLALGDPSNLVRMPARVAWARGDALGLMFAGASTV